MNQKNLLLLAAIPALSGVIAKESKPMNIIYIMSDDHTSQAVGVYNSRLAPLNPTPTIDGLAKEGIVFDNCFCGNSISSPSRATMLTGQHSHHNTVLTLAEALRPTQLYLPREMQKLGYQTAMVGKWHVDCEPIYYDYYSVLSGNTGQGTYFDPEFATSDVKGKPFPTNTIQTKGHSSDVITDITLDWLKNKRDKNRPFFLMHHYKAPHDLFEYAPRYEDYLADVEIPMPETLHNREGFGSVATRGVNDSLVHFIGSSISTRNTKRNYVKTYKIDTGSEDGDTKAAYDRYIKSYLRCVKGVDDNLARLFTYLKENDLWENTVIVYTGDQGMILGEHDLRDKRWMYEESLRMPYIMKVPGTTRAGEHDPMLISNIDFAPTLLSLAGREGTPEYMDGDDFSPIFFSKKEPKGWREACYYRYWMHMAHHAVPAHFGIRTKDYKLIFFYGCAVDPVERYGAAKADAVAHAEAKLAAAGKNPSLLITTRTPAGFELYDMHNDPFETTNLAEDPKYADVLAKLKKQLLELKAEVGDYDARNPEVLEIIEQNF